MPSSHCQNMISPIFREVVFATTTFWHNLWLKSGRRFFPTKITLDEERAPFSY